MHLLIPEIGTLIWQTIAFLILLFLLAKFAWKPVLKSIGERERSIESALDAAEKAKEEMARLTSENDQLLKAARAERDLILNEAKTLKEQILRDAKEQASEEGTKLVERARQEIEHQKALALGEVKNQVSSLALDIARKVLHKEYQSTDNQEALVEELLKDIRVN